jgi:hypothetical protein
MMAMGGDPLGVVIDDEVGAPILGEYLHSA